LKKIFIKFLLFIAASSVCIIATIHIIKNTDIFHHYSYYKYGCFDNFEDYQDDFNVVRDAVYRCGNGTYYITCKNKDLHDKNITNETQISISEIDSKRELELSEHERQSVLNIMMNSGNGTGFCWIRAEDDYFFWQHDAKGGGIIFTEDIKDTVEHFDDRTHSKHGYSKMGDDWYGFYI